MPSVIIEHLEPVLGKWIWLEYRHVSRMVGRENLLFTNVRSNKERSKLRELGMASRKSIVQSWETSGTKIILDPQSAVSLMPEDFTSGTHLVLGGILGDHPPIGRTNLALTTKLPDTPSRNLGSHQFSIDGAVYIALQVATGKRITDIPIKIGVETIVSKKHVTLLPFAYPLVGGKPLMAPGLRSYLKKEIFEDEEIMFRTGRPLSVAQTAR
jgi:ribosome biogenesis SPOUT family RNA methylase Rps3